MTDKELLALAAKAHGDLVNVDGLGSWEPDGASGYLWDPLHNDGAALRLAVKLGISVSIDNYNKRSWAAHIENSESHGKNPYAATRRAIVHAAAAIGEQAS